MSSTIPPRSRKAAPVPIAEIKVRRHTKEKRQKKERPRRRENDDAGGHSLKDLASELMGIVEEHSSQLAMNESEEQHLLHESCESFFPYEESTPSKMSSTPSPSLFLLMLPRLKSDDAHSTRRFSTGTHLRRLSQQSMSSSGTDFST